MVGSIGINLEWIMVTSLLLHPLKICKWLGRGIAKDTVVISICHDDAITAKKNYEFKSMKVCPQLSVNRYCHIFLSSSEMELEKSSTKEYLLGMGAQ